jgi:hypothetical protein
VFFPDLYATMPVKAKTIISAKDFRLLTEDEVREEERRLRAKFPLTQQAL